jgi:hypothetical protein
MFRRLHLVPVPDLPNQEAFAATLTRWWNETPDRQTRRIDWVRNYAKLLWSALKRAESLAVIHT